MQNLTHDANRRQNWGTRTIMKIYDSLKFDSHEIATFYFPGNTFPFFFRADELKLWQKQGNIHKKKKIDRRKQA